MAEKTIKLNLDVDSSKGETSIKRTSTKIKALGTTAAASGAAIGTGSKIASGGMLLLGASTASTLSKLKDQYKQAGKAADQAKKTSTSMVEYARAMTKANDAATALGKEVKKSNSFLSKTKKILGGAGSGLIGAWHRYKLAIGAAAAVFGYAFYKGVKSATMAASDLQEVQGKFDVVFKGQTQLAEKWATTLVDSYIMSTREAKQYLSSVQDLLVPMGMASDEAGKMSFEVVKLSADLASFNNMPTKTVMDAIQSALVGNYETMKTYGVVINETVVKQKALAMGLWNGKGMLDANTKAQVAFKLMLEGSAAAIGDVDRTSGSFANQLKKLNTNIEDINATIGGELLPIITAWVVQVNTMIKNNPELIKQIGAITKGILELATALGKLSLDFFSDFQYSMLGITLAKSGYITWAESMDTDMVRLYHQTGLNLNQREEIERLEKKLHLAQVGYNRAETRGHEETMLQYKARMVKLEEEIKIRRDLGKKTTKIFGTDKPEPTVLETITVTAKAIPDKHPDFLNYENEFKIFEAQLLSMSKGLEKFDVEKALKRQREADQKLADHEKVLQYISTEEENEIRAINNKRELLLKLTKDTEEIRRINMAADEQAAAIGMSKLEEWAKGVEELKGQMVDWEGVAVHAAEAFSSGMTDAFFEFAEGTKSAEDAFKDFAASFLKQIAKIIMQQLILNALRTAANAYFGDGGVVDNGEQTLAKGGVFSQGKMMEYAKGAAFNNGMKMQAFAGGGVVNSPTIFPMKNGMGLMGEAGPEAIMPLKRGKDGKLGVEGGGGNTINTTINVTTGGQGEDPEESKQRGRKMARIIEAEFNKNLTKQMRPGGLLNQQ